MTKRPFVERPFLSLGVIMKNVTIHKAQPVYNTNIIQSVLITIDKPFPDTLEPLEKSIDRMDEDAKTLSDVLFHTLPQGTVERLISRLLILRGSMFVGVTTPNEIEIVVSRKGEGEQNEQN